MFRRPTSLIVPCLAAMALLAFPAESRAGRVWDCLFGNAPPSQTTYEPTFAPVYAAPVYAAPSCEPCSTPCVPSCSPCVQQSCGYMPSVVYSALYRPAGWNAYAAPTVTTYRPFLGTYQTRLVPYTTYRPIYVPAVTYQSCYAPSYSTYYSPCYNSCNPCVSCDSGACGTSSSSCSSCGVAPQSAPPAAPQFAPQTYERKVEKPAENSLQPIPQQPDAQLNSAPAPALPDPNDRRAVRPAVRQAARVQPAGYALPAPADRNDGGWHAVGE